MPQNWNYKTAAHNRFNDGTSSDLSQSLAQRPGWLLSVQAFSVSSVGIASLFIFDTSVSVTTSMTPIWQGIVPFQQLAGSSMSAGGAGFVADLAGGITLNNGLAYAVSSGITVATLSTMPASQIKVNLQYQTSSCL